MDKIKIVDKHVSQDGSIIYEVRDKLANNISFMKLPANISELENKNQIVDQKWDEVVSRLLSMRLSPERG